MSMLKKAEDQLAGAFKDLPKLPESSKESLARLWPWLALIFGVLQLLLAIGLWNYMRDFEKVSDYVNSVSLYLTGTQAVLSGFDKMVIYLGIAILLLDAVILLMAYAPLKARARRGWDLLFLGSLINAVYAVVSLFRQGGGIGNFIFALLGSAIGFYLLFQVREKFTKTSS